MRKLSITAPIVFIATCILYIDRFDPKQNPTDGSPLERSLDLTRSNQPVSPETTIPFSADSPNDRSDERIESQKSLNLDAEDLEADQHFEKLAKSACLETRELIRSQAICKSFPFRLSAIRALAFGKHNLDAQILQSILLDSSESFTFASEAIIALGNSEAENSTILLIEAFGKTELDDLKQCILLSIARKPFADTYEFIKQLSENPIENPVLKRELIANLALPTDLTEAPVSREAFIKSFLSDPDVELRRGAYRALGSCPGSDTSLLLLTALGWESESLVRGDIYNALFKNNCENPLLLYNLTTGEAEKYTQLLAARAVSSYHHALPNNLFEKTLAPTLMTTAIRGDKIDSIMAVHALAGASSTQTVKLCLSTIAIYAKEMEARESAARKLQKQAMLSASLPQ